MGVSVNSGTPKSSILIGFSIINHPFWGTPIFGNTHIAHRPSFIIIGLRLVSLSFPCLVALLGDGLHLLLSTVHLGDVRTLQGTLGSWENHRLKHTESAIQYLSSQGPPGKFSAKKDLHQKKKTAPIRAPKIS